VKIVIDSYAWIELFSGTEKGRKVKDIIENSEEIYTPDIVLAEIARKYLRESEEKMIINSRLESITAASTITAIDAKLAFEAAKCYLELMENARKLKLNTPGLFDAIILATCRLLESKIVTGDEHFRNLPETIWIG
jgi:predicted nucleic acid-binding protein